MTVALALVGVFAAFCILFVAGAGVIRLCRWFFETLPEEDADMEEPKKQFRKVVRKDPPALVRIRELGWFMPCGHHAYEWCSYKHVCLQCVLEGRVAKQDGGRQ